jgi:hypothetical protein
MGVSATKCVAGTWADRLSAGGAGDIERSGFTTACPPPRRDCEIFLFWSDVADMCKVIYTMSVNYFIDKGGESA